ncbi:hypothetical protein CBR_g36843 [Chara braunii]|uniref:Reverse transcriptase domain-containing protein n=1 Tax=Chara braunii TaxID=69332 RepID=A0A388LLM6_CHABU|nr:hypothetical protein CBR_g36843 [Chara braunii]|eukprot:GBG83228.1 hypothetical protein CBR_g36843 [Chara braunii]
MPKAGGASGAPKKGLTLDDLIAAIDRHERNLSNIPKVDKFHFCGERVSEWLERVEQALVGRPDVVKFQRILQYVLHSYHQEVKAFSLSLSDVGKAMDLVASHEMADPDAIQALREQVLECPEAGRLELVYRLPDGTRNPASAQAKSVSRPFLGDDSSRVPKGWNEGELIIGEPDFLLPQERTLMVELMKMRHRAYAFTDEGRDRLDVDKIHMIRIHTVPHGPWNMRGMRYPNPDEEKKVVDYLDGKIRTHVADYSSEPYASPWFCFIKPNGTLRWVQDLQRLNAVTVRGAGGLPNADALSESYAGRPIISLIDLYSGYDQFPVYLPDRPVTAMHTPRGLIHMNVAPQGWTNAVAMVQRAMIRVMQSVSPHITQPYIDDSAVKGPAVKESDEVSPGVRRFVWKHIQEGEAVENTPPVYGFLDQEEDVRLHINKWSPRVPSCVGYPIWQAPSGYERRAELVLKPFEEEDPWGGKDIQWMMELALASKHSLVEDIRTIQEGPGQVERHEDLMGGMYLLVNTLLQESLDQSSSLNPIGNVDEVPESQDDEFEEGEIKDVFRAEEYDEIYLELGLLLSCEMRLRDTSDRAQRMLQRYLVRDDHLFVRREVGNPKRVVCGRNCQIDVVAALHDGIAGGHRGVQATSDFTKTAMPRGGKGTRPPQRPLGASGGYERHGLRYRESTPVYDDGDIELFLDNFWDHARPSPRGEERGRQAEEVPREEVPREEVPQEEVQDTQRERGLDDEGRRAGKEVIEVGEDTPPQTRAVGLRLGDAPGNTRQVGEGLQREEAPLPSSEKASSLEERAERRREREAVRREALTLIDRHLAAHALEHPDLEEPTPAEPRKEPCQPEKEMEAEIPKRVDLRTRETAPTGETIEEKRARRTRRIDEIWQERQRLEAAGELPEQQQKRQRSKAAGALSAIIESLRQRSQGEVDKPESSRQGEQSQPGHGLPGQPSAAETSQEPPIGRVILEAEKTRAQREGRAKREAEREAFEFRAPTELATLPIAAAGPVIPLADEEGLPPSSSEPAQGSAAGSMDVLIEAVHSMQEEVSLFSPERRIEEPLKREMRIEAEGVIEGGLQRLGTPEYGPEGIEDRPGPST